MGYDQKFVVLQQYDTDMKKTSSVDNDGNFSYTEFNADGDIVSYSTNEDNAVISSPTEIFLLTADGNRITITEDKDAVIYV